jgi:hypothetical protein
MAKINLSDPVNLRNEQTALGTLAANNRAIEQAIEKSLSRDGTSPNEMNSDFDMNSHRVINLPEPIGQTEPIRKGDTDTLIAQLAAAVPTGPQGPIGPIGPQGLQGLQGLQGIQGIPGPAGAGNGDVTGPAGAVDGEIVLFNGATGKVLKRATGTGLAHVTNGVYSVSLVITADITNNNVTYGKIQQANPVTLLGNPIGATANVSEITLNATLSFTGTTLQRAALTGDVTAPAGSNATTIADNSVSYVKMQDVSATAHVIGRKTAGAGDPEECTLSQILDFVGSAADGDILFRNAGVWTRLPKGSDTQVLTLASGVPTWAAAAAGGGGLTLITSQTAPAANTFNITGLGGFKMLVVSLRGIAQASGAARTLQCALSGNNGSSYGTARIPSNLSVASGTGLVGDFFITRVDQTNNQLVSTGALVGVVGLTQNVETGSLGPINAIQLSWTVATPFSAGDVDVYGLK